MGPGVPTKQALSAAKSDKDPLNETTSTILHAPTDKPINLDISAFLTDTQKGKSELDALNDVFWPKQHDLGVDEEGPREFANDTGEAAEQHESGAEVLVAGRCCGRS